MSKLTGDEWCFIVGCVCGASLVVLLMVGIFILELVKVWRG